MAKSRAHGLNGLESGTCGLLHVISYLPNRIAWGSNQATSPDLKRTTTFKSKRLP
jgi:hypothetical protein